MVWGDTGLNHVSKIIHNLVSVQPKCIKLGQMTNLDVIFHVLVSSPRQNVKKQESYFRDKVFIFAVQSLILYFF